MARGICRLRELEREAAHAREAQSEAQQRAAAAEGQVAVLQKTLQKAEERAQLREMQVR